MTSTWDWADNLCGVHLQQTTEQKQPAAQPTAQATNTTNVFDWNAPQSPQGREAPNMYSTNSPGERVDYYSPGSNDNNSYQYQLQPAQSTGYQNYQLGGQQQFVQQPQQQQQLPYASPPAGAPPSPPDNTNLALAPAMPIRETAVVTPQAQAAGNPFDVFATSIVPAAQPAAYNAPVDPFGAAPTTPTQSSPVAAPADPLGAFTTYAAAPAAQPYATNAPADPFGAAPTTPNAPADPFGAAPTTPTSSLPEEDDFWAQMGFGQIDHAANVSAGSVTPTSDLSVSDTSATSFTPEPVNPHSLDERGLPIGGEYYIIRVTTPLLGAIFTAANEVRNTLYKTASFQFVESLKKRPVVSFRIDGSAAETSGVGIGHVLLNVNGQPIPDTDTAVKVLSESPRPMTLEFYAPGQRQVHICKTEGMCMVKYDSRETMHPRTSKEWKPKYVVIGDLLGKPNVIYMYRSKFEYDIAVRESQTSPRTLSVKVKQFDITGARILKRGQVRYTNQPAPWYYFVIVREFGLPIKISAESEEQLAPVYDGIAAYLAKSKRKPATAPQWMK
mmetsp:Transcript_15657/g.22261  ORF Transcript_15657/g.22261 Transcript_15657/m.22261 type:complete len:556 (-) Transcript_15657:141-1808(-)|eukprot:CAMPEP_0201697108 /NCGR_PEP_ID=MMETSP0578-20130828/9511_1 /ASSEMBLY_ACC=CAM_ASM_000663 /TAXON_ID=267565 /ORGANISM="Skeletonema grethea, Strain CCMP 1804" /LENGTH=555 /DNA_ID=CAMNT_0048183187 /DNA_START=54 /DNA_END=1721 /DNA_ORIENTATION=-